MYCRNCGSEIAEGSKFCNRCGSPVQSAADALKPAMSAASAVHTDTGSALQPGIEEPVAQKPIFEEFQWNVSEYPDRNAVSRTEDIDFNWNTDPASIAEMPKNPGHQTVMTGGELEKEIFNPTEPKKSPEEMSAAERIDKFYTFSSKNEEFQRLINNEYQRVKAGNAIEHELSQADKFAAEKFDTRIENPSMEAFLEKEGIVKPYQPKAFESDVLQRIAAQEEEKEIKRLEEEARLAAIEAARLEAEAQRKTEEEARRKAAEEAARMKELARIKAEEEAKAAEEKRRRIIEEARAAEEARLRAEKEARIRAEEAARRKAEEETRIRAEAEARFKAAEEARLKAEAELKAAQEAAKIRAQQEARLASEAEAKLRAEQERKRLEEEEVKKELEEKRRFLAQEADQVIAQEEARKVLEQTARLREQEQAKIRAAVAGLRSGSALYPDEEKLDEAELAHRAARNQINEMAKAREDFFAELDETPEPQEEIPVAEEIKPANPVTGRETMLSSDEMAKTRIIKKGDLEAGLQEATRVAKIEPKPAAIDDDDFFRSLEAAGEPQEEQIEEAQPIDFKEPVEEPIQPVDDLEELLSKFEEAVPGEEYETPAEALEEAVFEENSALNDTMLIGDKQEFDDVPKNDFDSYGNDAIEPHNIDPKPVEDDFYSNDFYGEEENLSKKELKQREKERAKEEKAARKKKKRDYIKDDDHSGEESEGGASRIVLKVILTILIIIFAVEIVGMGIRFLAPQSKAAEFIDSQLNKVIQLITGDDTEYSVIAAQVRTEPMEDKTELINAQVGKNKNGNIESIVYNAGLGYDQSTDGKVSDLVLSTPMTVAEWGRDDKNYPVYYDEQVVGQIIAFISNKAELISNGDERVLKMIKPDAALYNETASLKGTSSEGGLSKLEIGEIRQAGSNYYVWVNEIAGDNTVRKVYSMYPEKKFVMKMNACYVV